MDRSDNAVWRTVEAADAMVKAARVDLVGYETTGGGYTTAVVARNLEEHLPFMATETRLMKATAAGGDRQELHERIRQHAHAAAREMKEGRPSDRVERIAGDPAFGMDAAAIQGLMDARRFVGRAPEQVDRFLSEWVDPILQRYSDPSSNVIGDPDVRV